MKIAKPPCSTGPQIKNSSAMKKPNPEIIETTLQTLIRRVIQREVFRFLITSADVFFMQISDDLKRLAEQPAT
jgi:hypothetical protein